MAMECLLLANMVSRLMGLNKEANLGMFTVIFHNQDVNRLELCATVKCFGFLFAGYYCLSIFKDFRIAHPREILLFFKLIRVCLGIPVLALGAKLA